LGKQKPGPGNGVGTPQTAIGGWGVWGSGGRRRGVWGVRRLEVGGLGGPEPGGLGIWGVWRSSRAARYVGHHRLPASAKGRSFTARE
jgi:hypothetical protein